jgi:succinoglycan biosynthesis transport protein ExoP
MSEHPTNRTPISMSTAVRHHVVVVLVGLVLGALAGYLYAANSPTTFTSTARVLVNPVVGNPFVPSESSVRQDEPASLETEAQVARSNEVLDVVAGEIPTVSLATLERQVQVSVPPNTQVLEISFTAGDAEVAQLVANTVAETYLANRSRRFEEVNQARIQRVETRTLGVVEELRAATEAAQTGNAAEKLFQEELAGALRNELVNLRAQRTALENSEGPAGAVIAPAGDGERAADLKALAIPFGVAFAGLALGCLLALLLERLGGVVRSARDVEALGVPVAAAVPPPSLRGKLLRSSGREALDTTIRRVRATVLELDPRPDVITIAPAGSGRSDADTSEAVAESFAKAGHRVVLVRTDPTGSKDSLGVDDRGLAQALLYERMNVLDCLQPTVEPLLCLLSDGGFTDESRELLVADRVRAVLSPLIESGHLVVIQSPGIDSAEAVAFVGAADLSLVVVTLGRTRPRAVEQVATLMRSKRQPLTALVLGRGGAGHRDRLPGHDTGSRPSTPATTVAHQVTRADR